MSESSAWAHTSAFELAANFIVDQSQWRETKKKTLDAGNSSTYGQKYNWGPGKWGWQVVFNKNLRSEHLWKGGEWSGLASLYKWGRIPGWWWWRYPDCCCFHLTILRFFFSFLFAQPLNIDLCSIQWYKRVSNSRDEPRLCLYRRIGKEPIINCSFRRLFFFLLAA